MKRILVLLATVGNIIFNSVYPKISDLPQIKIISDKYFNLFTPAGYAFTIWGIIYLSFIVYAVVQVLPMHRKRPIFDRLAPLFILINLLSSVWIYLFTSEQLLLSVITLFSTLIFAVALFLIADKEVKDNGNTSGWLLVPVSLFAGWISVAVIANTSAYLVSMGWYGGSFGQQNWTITMIVVAGILGILFTITRRNSIFPLVVAWAVFAIRVAREDEYPAIATTALAVAVVLVIVSAFVLFRNKITYPK